MPELGAGTGGLSRLIDAMKKPSSLSGGNPLGWTVCAAAAMTLLAASAPRLLAQAGTLDESFGERGVTGVTLASPRCHQVLVLPDGKILLSGTSQGSGFALVKFDAGGQLDGGFGGGGVSQVKFANGPRSGVGMLLVEEGRILVGAMTGLARFLPDGSLDTRFGTGGGIITSRSFGNLRRMKDGRIFTAGGLLHPRLDGTHDAGFGDGGLVPKRPNDRGFGSPVEQPDGKLIFIGGAHAGVPNEKTLPEIALLTRVQPDGTPDPSFGHEGRVSVRHPRGRWTQLLHPVLQPDGKILVLLRYDSLSDFVIQRYNPDGKPDTAFGQNGLLTTDFDRKLDQAAKLVLQPDGKILVAGTTKREEVNIALVRYLPDGRLDPTFGQGGKVVTDVGLTQASASTRAPASGDSTGADAKRTAAKSGTGIATGSRRRITFVADMVLQPDGKILVADGNYTLVRYLGDSPSEPPKAE